MTPNHPKSVSINGLYANRGFMTIVEPGVYEATSLPWELMVKEAGKQPFKHWKDYLVTPSITLYRAYFQAAVHVIGLSPPNILSLSIPITLGDKTSYWNQSIKKNTLPITMPGELNSFFNDEQDHIILLINLKLINQYFSHEQIEKLKDSSNHHFIQSSAEKIQLFNSWLNKVLINTLNEPSMLSDQFVIQSFEQELLKRLEQSIDLVQTKKKRAHISLRQKGLKKALDYLHSSDNLLKNIPEICRVSNISQRTLEYAFQDSFNLTPIEFIQRLRLHKFRHKLLFSSTDSHTVTSSANELGLEQIGRISGEYKNHFNEYPSETLKRTVNRVSPGSHVLQW